MGGTFSQPKGATIWFALRAVSTSDGCIEGHRRGHLIQGNREVFHP